MVFHIRLSKIKGLYFFVSKIKIKGGGHERGLRERTLNRFSHMGDLKGHTNNLGLEKKTKFPVSSYFHRYFLLFLAPAVGPNTAGLIF